MCKFTKRRLETQIIVDIPASNIGKPIADIQCRKRSSTDNSIFFESKVFKPKKIILI